jgi:hypothetical protein
VQGSERRRRIDASSARSQLGSIIMVDCELLRGSVVQKLPRLAGDRKR